MYERKRNVVNAAQKLFIEKGFQNTSIQDILEEAKISKGTFYNYFNSKRECLIAIIENGLEEVQNRRRKLLVSQEGQYINSPDFLVEQMAITAQVNRDENLIPIYEAIFQSGDPELQRFITQNYLLEMDWLASRIVDIYGEEAKPYSYDCTILIHGMQRQMITAWRIIRKEPFDIKEIIRYVLKRMDVIIKQLIKQNDIFLGDQAKDFSLKEVGQKKVTEKQIVIKLKEFLNDINEESQAGKEYCEALLNEFESAKLKMYVIEALVISFTKVFDKTVFEKGANDVSGLIWSFIEENRK